ncbi:hypothetical protein B0H34DRAFT_802257 [Crassisporium funariophilum]|nr:hypothetical protein B0H34DRAFT_802257 [Crassisporium funariophilum]
MNPSRGRAVNVRKFLLLIPLLFPIKGFGQGFGFTVVTNLIVLPVTAAPNPSPAAVQVTPPVPPAPPVQAVPQPPPPPVPPAVVVPFATTLTVTAAPAATTPTPRAIEVANSNSISSSSTSTLLAAPTGPPDVLNTATNNPLQANPPTRCNPRNTHPHPLSHKLLSQCSENTFCSSTGLTNGTCIPVLCRRDEFPFGYGFGGGEVSPVLLGQNGNGGGGVAGLGGVEYPNIEGTGLGLGMNLAALKKPKKKVKGKTSVLTSTVPLPPLCSNGTFCPDDGSGCRTQVRVGGACELGRDEQCTPPPGYTGGAVGIGKNETAGGLNGGPVCLNLVCQWANATLNQPCLIENTTYTSDLHVSEADGDGEAVYIMNVIKHNCFSPGLFCDPNPTDASTSAGTAVTPTCQKTKAMGKTCRFDAECDSRNCAPPQGKPDNSPTGTCVDPPATPMRIAPWHWGATAFCIVGAMTSAAILLTFIHRRHRYVRYKELREYYHEQMSLRRSILALHAAAAERYSGAKVEKSGHLYSEGAGGGGGNHTKEGGAGYRD